MKDYIKYVIFGCAALSIVVMTTRCPAKAATPQKMVSKKTPMTSLVFTEPELELEELDVVPTTSPTLWGSIKSWITPKTVTATAAAGAAVLGAAYGVEYSTGDSTAALNGTSVNSTAAVLNGTSVNTAN